MPSSAEKRLAVKKALHDVQQAVRTMLALSTSSPPPPSSGYADEYVAAGRHSVRGAALSVGGLIGASMVGSGDFTDPAGLLQEAWYHPYFLNRLRVVRHLLDYPIISAEEGGYRYTVRNVNGYVTLSERIGMIAAPTEWHIEQYRAVGSLLIERGDEHSQKVYDAYKLPPEP